MSGRMVGEVLKHAPDDLTQLELLVLVALAEAAAEKDRTARYDVGSDHLAFKVRSTPGTVKNAIRSLKDRGLIVPLFEKPRRGLAQNYRIPKMTDATRRAVLRGSLPDAPMPTTKGAPPSDPEPGPNGPAKGHPPVTQSPVDNSVNGHEKGSPGAVVKGHSPVPPPGKDNSRNPKTVPTHLPAGVAR